MKRLFVLVLALFIVFGLANLVRADLIFNLDFKQDGNYENYRELKPGETVLIDIYVSNVPDSGLISMGFDIVYDQTQLEVVSAYIDWINWYIGSVQHTSPEIEMKGGRITGLSGDNIKLGTIELKCKALGISELLLYDSDQEYGFGHYDDFVLANGTVLDYQIVNGVKLAEINNVPIPSTLLLLGSGLIGFLGLGRRMLTH